MLLCCQSRWHEWFRATNDTVLFWRQNLQIFFFCKVIQALDTPLQSSFSKDAGTWQGHWAPGHQYLLTCVHKAPGILVGKAEIEEFCFANHKLFLGLQIIQNYPFQHIGYNNSSCSFSVLFKEDLGGTDLVLHSTYVDLINTPSSFPLKNPTLECKVSVGLLCSLPSKSTQHWRS